jgi:integrase/recombinase XerD
MNNQYSISIFIDTRREKSNKKYPVKLRVYATQLRKQKFYPTIFEFTRKEFASIWETQKPREEYKDTRLEMQALESLANKTAKLLKPFSFEQFEKKLFRKSGEGENVFYQYQLIIDKNKKFDRYGNASNYEMSLKSIKAFLHYSKGKEPARLQFYEITPAWLNNYENFMLVTKERSRTTVSMYLRALRAVFNSAISENEIEPEVYPFGKKKYQVPSVKKVKKSLTKEQLRKLFEAKPRTPEQEEAKDLWFFSYACNGMNVKDIALLRHKDLENDKIVYYRAKTINTAKADLKPIVVYLNEWSLSIINKYGNYEKQPDGLIFKIVQNSDSEIIKFNKIKNFTRFINQNLKILAIAESLPKDISTYWARHSFSTNAIRNGASMEFVSEALNHSDLKTTQNYFAGFEDADKKELMKKMMNF